MKYKCKKCGHCQREGGLSMKCDMCGGEEFESALESVDNKKESGRKDE